MKVFGAVVAAVMAVETIAAAEPKAGDVRRVPLPDASLSYREITPYPTLAWAALQLVPSPELAFGRQHRIQPGVVDRAVSTAFGPRSTAQSRPGAAACVAVARQPLAVPVNTIVAPFEPVGAW